MTIREEELSRSRAAYNKLDEKHEKDVSRLEFAWEAEMPARTKGRNSACQATAWG